MVSLPGCVNVMSLSDMGLVGHSPRHCLLDQTGCCRFSRTHLLGSAVLSRTQLHLHIKDKLDTISFVPRPLPFYNGSFATYSFS